MIPDTVALADAIEQHHVRVEAEFESQVTWGPPERRRCDRGTDAPIQHFIQHMWRHGPSSNIISRTERRT